MPDDPMRALDDVTPPDLWDGITARAAGGDLPVDRPGHSHRPLLAVAAVVLVLAAVAGGLVLAARGDPSPAVEERTTIDDPSRIWGRRWELQRLVVGGEEVGVPDGPGGAEVRRPGPYQYFLDTTSAGTVGFTGCNAGAAPAGLVGDRLDVDAGEYLQTQVLCGSDLGDMDAVLVSLLMAEPTVAIHGAELTLRSGDTVADFIDLEYEPEQVDESLAAIWGREWDLFGLVVDGERTGVPPIGTGTDGARPAGSAVYLDLTTEGTVGFTGCNGGSTQAELVDGRLVADTDWLSEAADCSDDGGGDFSGFGDDLMALDETMAALIQADPEVILVDNQLTLTAGDTSARFFDPAARPPAPAEGDELVPSRGSDCVVGIRGGRDREWGLTPGGPLSPDEGWLDDSSGVRSGLWEVTDGELTAEIQVPGQTVIDLVGERVEEVVLDDWGPATVWYRGGSVQVRAFPVRDDSGPCDAFTVTVAGPAEAANQAFAVAVANQVLAGRR